MFRAKTVLVVGAGASSEFGFPLGEALLKNIAERIDISYQFDQMQRGDHIIAQALRSALNAEYDITSYNEHLHSAWQLVASSKQALSIDNVLDALEDEKTSLVGKFGIARSILVAEEACSLSRWVAHLPDSIDITEFSNTWLDQFTKILTEGRRKSDVANIFENVSIINFNYDRVIEQYLPFSIANYYGMTVFDTREILKTLPIFHPYGKVGTLPWEREEDSVEFGHCHAPQVEAAARQILTFTEQVQDRNLVSGIQNAIQSADRIVFLGFGYHRQNLDLLRSHCQKHVQILGTSFKMSKSDTETICDEMESIFGLSSHTVITRGHSYARLFPLECAGFISEVRRTLTGDPGEDPTTEFPSIHELGLR